MNKIQLVIQKCITEGIEPKTCTLCLGKKVVKEEPCFKCEGTGTYYSKWYRIHQSAIKLQEDIDLDTSEVSKAQSVYAGADFSEVEHSLSAKATLDDYINKKRNAIKPRIVHLLKSAGLI
jgi:hypothetical protein